jgi:cell division initiation protein
MALTPVEIRHMTPGRALLGYSRGATDRLLGEVADSFEDVWRERADLSDKVEQLENDLVRYRELESLLRTTLVSAERASAELKEQARREAELILTEAHAEARQVQRKAFTEHERLHSEATRLRAQLTAALETLDPEPEADEQPPVEAPVAEEPVAKEPVAEEPVAEEAPSGQPAIEEPHAEEPGLSWHTPPDVTAERAEENAEAA